jgi:nucleotide-binding universal stress UspA family protein
MGAESRATTAVVSEADALGGEPGTFTRILVLVDGGAAAARAVQMAADLTERDGADLALLAVVDRRLTYSAEAGIPAADLLSGLHRAAATVSWAGSPSRSNSAACRPAGSVRQARTSSPRAARAWRADLLVVGREEPTLLGRFLPGVVDQIASQAPCPVLVVGPTATGAHQAAEGSGWWTAPPSEEESDRAREALA